MRRWFLLPLLSLLLGACDPLPAGDGRLLLGWRFVDGRRCADSAVEQVVLARENSYTALAVENCPVGFEQTAMQVTLASGTHHLELTGISASQTPLYRGAFTVDLWPDTRVDRIVSLRFIGEL